MGAYISLRSKRSDDTSRGILWGVQLHPLFLSLDGETWRFALRKKRWTVPFTITLDTFTRSIVEMVFVRDFVTGLIKAVLFGFTIAIVLSARL